MLLTCSSQTARLAAVLLAVIGVSSAAPALTLRIDGVQAITNSDTLVEIGSSVSVICNDDGTSVAGDLFFNDIDAVMHKTLLRRQSDGVWMITAMSLEHQGAYRCCIQAQCEEVAVITVPPDATASLITVEGEQPALSCPLQVAERLSEYYMVEWRVPVDRTVAASGSGVKVPWARLNNDTLELTVGPLNSTLPRVFECVLLSFKRRNLIPFSNAPKGTVRITIPSTQQLQVTVSPSVIASGSSDHFNVSCAAKNGQNMHNAKYQFFRNGMATSAPSNVSYTMVPATTTVNITCNATQYTDLRTPIPSQLSPPVQAILLDAPSLSGSHTGIDNDCMQEVTVSLQQPIPDEMYYAFSSENTDSCMGLRGMQAVDINTGKSQLMFTVNVGDSGLDTRQRLYLTSWFVMEDTMGPCNNIQLLRTAAACPPSPTILSVGAIAGIVVAVCMVLAIIAILGMCTAYYRGKTKGLLAKLCAT